MEVINNINSISDKIKNGYLALGNFDGVHKGHQKLIERCKQLAKHDNTCNIVLTFDPHPQLILKNVEIEGLLTTKKIKQQIFKKMGVDYVVFIPFSKEIASLSPESFINFLFEKFAPRGLIVGFNYTFGKGGSGTPQDLKRYGKSLGFTVEIIPPVYINHNIVSSSLIRKVIKNGNIPLAKKYLGYYPLVLGRVSTGEKRGRELGFPTANIIPEKNILIPPNGVYVTKARVKGKEFCSVTNIGRKPTFGKYDKRIETHIMNFHSNIYNECITISFIEKIRDEKKFSTHKQLIEQIKEDIKYAKQIFKKNTPITNISEYNIGIEGG